MEKLLAHLDKLTQQKWLVNYDAKGFQARVQAKYQELSLWRQTISPLSYPTLLINESDSLSLLTVFLAGIAAQFSLLLVNPQWRERELKQLNELIQTNLEYKEGKISKNISHTTNISNLPLIILPTGGSSGKVRLVTHTWQTFANAALGLYHYLGKKPLNSYCLLPLYHVSGLMQFFRSFLTQGKLCITPYQQLKQGNIPSLSPQQFFISLVPTQLRFLIDSHPLWLAKFQGVFLGGAAIETSLLEKARKYNIPLAPIYGMTETAAGIALLKPEKFLQGNNSNGKILPHAQVRIEDAQGNKLTNNQPGKIAIASSSLYLGYYPQISYPLWHLTDDIGFFDADNYLHIIGRDSQKIITGGENVFPSEVESAILATNLVHDVAVIGFPDVKWGQVVTAIYVPQQKKTGLINIKEKISSQLAPYKHPKHWIAIEQLPRSPQGKLNHSEIENLIEKYFFRQQRSDID